MYFVSTWEYNQQTLDCGKFYKLWTVVDSIWLYVLVNNSNYKNERREKREGNNGEYRLEVS